MAESKIPPEEKEKLEIFMDRVAEDTLNAIERMLGDPMYSQVNDLLTYQARKGGKRLRPVMGLMVNQALYGNYDKMVDVATTCEMIHNGTLMVDDVIDKDMYRRGKPSAPATFGLGSAILGGFQLAAFAIEMGMSKSFQVGQLLSQAVSQLTLGNTVELRNNGFDSRVYKQVLEYKTASLFKIVAQLGAVMSDSNLMIPFAGSFGYNSGMMYQVADDVTDIVQSFKKGEADGDLREGKITLPIIHLFNETREPEIKDLLFAYSKKKPLGKEGLLKLKTAMDELGSIRFAMEEAGKFQHEAEKAVDAFPTNEYAAMMRVFPQYMLEAIMSEVE